MLKFSGYSRLISGRQVRVFSLKPGLLLASKEQYQGPSKSLIKKTGFLTEAHSPNFHQGLGWEGNTGRQRATFPQTPGNEPVGGQNKEEQTCFSGLEATELTKEGAATPNAQARTRSL